MRDPPLGAEPGAVLGASRGEGITAAVLARDEAAFVGPCLASLGWADARLVLVDARTRDATAAIARQSADRVFVAPFESFPRFRNRALALAETSWLFFVDADERVSPALAAEVRRAVADAAEDGTVGYWVPRHNVIRGRPVRGAGWSPDYQLRVLRRGAARYDAASLVHEVATLDGPAGWLREPLVHYNYATLREFVSKQGHYAALDARAGWWRGERPRARGLVGQPAREFWRRFATLGGYRDGALGFLLAAYLAYAAYQRTRALGRLWRERGSPPVRGLAGVPRAGREVSPG